MAEIDCLERSLWHVVYDVPLGLTGDDPPDRVSVRLALSATRSWHLSPDRQLRPVEGSVSPPWPVGGFAVVQNELGYFQVHLGAAAHPRFVQARDTLVATITLRDRRTCGLRVWGEDKLCEPSFRHAYRLIVSRLNAVEEAVWAEPFPSGARSCICLTDHPDWDSVEKSSALHRLFAVNGIRITKAVFPASDLGWDYGPGMDSHEYSAVIDRWWEAGNEIAYHGLGSGRDAPASLDDCIGRLAALDRYRPRTWIDHGRGDYLFVRQATLPGGASLLKHLSERGVHNYWSYADPWQNPASDLRIWHSRRAGDAVADFLTLTRRRGPTGPRQFAYLGSIAVKNLTGDEQYRRVLSRPWACSEWTDLVRSSRLLRELRRDPLYLYSRSGDFWPGSEARDLVFDTMLLNHVSLQLSPSNVERLVHDNGLLVAHTYLADTDPRGGRNCFCAQEPPRILGQFQENVQHMSMLQSRGDLVTTPLRDLREALSQYAQTRIIRRSDGWDIRGCVTICSHTPYKVAGEYIPSDPHGFRRTAVDGRLFLSVPETLS